MLWFASGIVMMYARMPKLPAEERLARLPSIPLAAIRVAPAEAAARLRIAPRAVRIGTLQRRPVYRFDSGSRAAAAFADDGTPVTALDPGEALEVVRAFSPEHAATVRVDRLLRQADQWTVSGELRAYFPLYKIALSDRDSTIMYVSAATGEPVLRTTTTGRRWGYLGAVVHWLYFTPLRRNGARWAQVVIWLSVAGCVMCLSGLVWGLWRYARVPRYRLKRVPSRTPYAGMMRWHHYAGLLFGLTTFTWIFSGLLSMDPWDWHPPTSPTRLQREAVSGGPFDLGEVTVSALRSAATSLVALTDARELEVVQFRGARFLLGYHRVTSWDDRPLTATDRAAFDSPSAPLPQALVALDAPNRIVAHFDDNASRSALEAAMPDVRIEEATWLQRYDAYYYDRGGALPLPVLRARYRDEASTWLYLDPRRGEIVRKEERWSRVNRWLYHGLHSLDFPRFYTSRPLWDIVVIVLSLGGLASTATAVPAGWRRLRRHARRVSPAVRS